jgi:hypothetical protein
MDGQESMPNYSKPPLQSKPPQRPLIAYLVSPTTRRTNITKFDFVPHQGLHRFFFLFNNKLPQSHIREHSFFCKHHSCPFHDY